ncbi:MAG: thioredoxin domain-containing protein [Phycisphaerae bacterium]
MLRDKKVHPSANNSGRAPLGRALWLSGVLLAMVVGGCSQNLVTVKNAADFEQQVLKSDRPVLIHFSKAGCSMCAVLSPTMGRLANEYDGRATVAEYTLMDLSFTVLNHRVQKMYDIACYPTVILFVKGRPTRKWVVHYEANDYRKALDEAIDAWGVQPSGGGSLPQIRSPGR